MNSEFLERIYDSLDNMIGYADDGMLDRNDPSYSDFFESLDTARDVLAEVRTKLDEIYNIEGDE